MAQGNNSLPQGNLTTKFGSGVLFVTYSLLVQGFGKAEPPPKTAEIEGGVDPEQPPQQAPKQEWRVPRGSRLHQIVAWLRSGKGDPLVVRALFPCLTSHA